MIPNGWRLLAPDDDGWVRVIGMKCRECDGRGAHPESWVDCAVCSGEGTV